ncbi:hypothetical protein [Coxiella-like endosymbiont]|uniref:hypothetical protein n=1 Tax=Coxiella-like endosymbiont TaxID=1592897 RepID=UPI00272D5DF1|nr:hypothetical protein [Coxiella-like endosymbiont]
MEPRVAQKSSWLKNQFGLFVATSKDIAGGKTSVEKQKSDQKEMSSQTVSVKYFSK